MNLGTFFRHKPVRPAAGKDGGALVLIGGNEDKKNDLAVLDYLIAINQARDVAVIPTASSRPRELADKYRRAFNRLGANKVRILDIRCPQEADRQEHHDAIRAAQLVFFTGGDQVKLVNTLRKTRLLERIRKAFRRGATVAGTSAGAAAAGDMMLYAGDRKGSYKGAVEMSTGFGFIHGLVVDTHFHERHRLDRLIQVLLRLQAATGIGLGEDTAVVISAGTRLQVIGSRMVSLVDARHVRYSNISAIEPGQRIVYDGIRVTRLQEGFGFDLLQQRIFTVRDSDSCHKNRKIS